MQPFEVTGRRLGNAALLYLALTITVITLAPFQFEPRPVHGLTTQWDVFDLVMNVVMFVPVGFIYALSRSRTGSSGSSWIGAVVLGAALSGAVETAQLFAPSRFPSLFDLATNTLGAGVGAWLAGVAAARGRAASTVRTLAVDLPLMGPVYLMAPLAWLLALGSEGGERAWASIPLAMGACWAISSVFTSFAQASPTNVLLVAGAWLAVALPPSASIAGSTAWVAAPLGLFAAWARTAAPPWLTHETHSGRSSRRFEAATLRLVLPVFCVYVALISLTPFAAPTTWSGTLSLTGRGVALEDVGLYRALEQLAAFTLLGYAIAEFHGRSRESFSALARSVLSWTAPASAVLQALRGWHPEHGASGVLFLLTLGGSVGGAWLYVLQLQHVQALGARVARSAG